MSLWFDKARKRWRYDFYVNKIRFAGFVIDPVTHKPIVKKSEAKLFVDGLKLTAKKAKSGERPRPGVFTLGMAMDTVAAKMEGKDEYRKYTKYIREFLSFYGVSTPISDINTARIQDYIDWALKQPNTIYVGGPTKQDSEDRKVRIGTKLRAPTTVKRHLNALHKAFGVANALIDPVTNAPFLQKIPDFPTVKTVKRLARPPEDALLGKMMVEAPPHLRDAIALSILMGYRKSEVFTQLTIDKVDLERRGVWLDGETTKGKRDEFVPANAEAMKILKRLIKQAKEVGQTRLILYWPAKLKNGKQPPPRPIKDAKTAWNTVRRKLGIKGRHRFHDLKAAYVTALAMNAAPRVVQELARHKSMATTQNYIRVADFAQRDAVEAIGKKRPILRLVDQDEKKKSTTKSQTGSPKQKGAPLSECA